MSPLPLEQDKDVGVTGFQAIKKVRGLLISIDVQPQPESWDGEGDVVRVDMEETTILEMFGDEETFDLKDGKFNFIMPYKLTSGGKIAPGTGYNECWRASAKEMGKIPSEFIGQYVTLDKQLRTLFTTYVLEENITGNMRPVLDEAGEFIIKGDKVRVEVLATTQEGVPKFFCFVADETADAENIKDYIRKLVVGLNERAVTRKLLVDPRAKQFKEFKDKHNAGTLAEYLGLVVVDGKFQEPKGIDEDSPSEVEG